VDTKYIHHVRPQSLFSYAFPASCWVHLQKGPVFTLVCFTFLKCILAVQGAFTLAFQMCIYRTLTRMMPPHYLLFLVTMLPIIHQPSGHCVIFLCRWTLSIFFIP
jgi:hypothetical protein